MATDPIERALREAVMKHGGRFIEPTEENEAAVYRDAMAWLRPRYELTDAAHTTLRKRLADLFESLRQYRRNEAAE